MGYVIEMREPGISTIQRRPGKEASPSKEKKSQDGVKKYGSTLPEKGRRWGERGGRVRGKK